MIKVFARALGPQAATKSAEIMIYDYIGEDWYGDGITAKNIDKKLKDFGASLEDIIVRINSPGGSVFDGIAIYNTLKSHKAKVHVVIEGVAASAASIIAMAGDRISMNTATQIMIHNPWTVALGDANDMRKTATALDSIRDGLVSAYSERTGLERAELVEMCDAETWMGPEEAIEMGFADDQINVREDDDADEEAAAAAALKFSAKGKQLLASFSKAPEAVKRVLNVASVTLSDEDMKAIVSAGRVTVSVPQLPAVAAVKSPSAAAVTTEVNAMTPEEIAAKAAADARAAAEAKAAADAALKADMNRRAGIKALFAKFPAAHHKLRDECCDDTNCDVQQASAKLIEALAVGAEPLLNHNIIIPAGQDERDKFLAGAEKAMLARMGVGPNEPGNEFNGASLIEIGSAALARAGISVRGMAKRQIASKIFASHTTSDFPILLSQVARKRLRDAFAQQPRTWNQWAAVGSVPDFKKNSRMSLGSFSSLVLKPEGGEYKQGTLGEEELDIQIATKGRYIELSREMLINDDLNGFGTMSRKMGQAAGRTVEIDAYAMLYQNSGLGPTMDDTGTFFNATVVTTAGGHANYVSSGTAISVASLGVAFAAMQNQRDMALQEYVGMAPKILLINPAYAPLAYSILKSGTNPAQTNPGVVNWAQTLNLTVVTSPYVQGTDWFLFADPAAAEAFEVAFLDGEQEPYIDEEVEFMTDSLKMKVRLDYGVAPIEWRAAYKNEGAAS